MTPPLPEPYGDAAGETLNLDVWWVTLVGCGAAAAVGVAGSAQVYLSMLGHGHDFLRILAWHMSSWVFWGLAAAIVLRVGSGLSISGGRSGGRAILIGVGLCALHMVITAQLTVWFQPFLPIPAPPSGRCSSSRFPPSC